MSKNNDSTKNGYGNFQNLSRGGQYFISHFCTELLFTFDFNK